MSSYETIRYDVEDHVAWLTLNRPEVMNAINLQMQNELQDVWKRIRLDSDVHVTVLTGAGDRAFTTGLDRTGMSMVGGAAGGDGPDIGEAERERWSYPPEVVPGSPGYETELEHTVPPKSAGCFKPVIAAINGIACGGAFYMIGESDIVIAADHATFFDPHVSLGMVAAYESMHMLQRVPLGEVLRMQLMGSYERLSAQRAHQIGLVSEVVPKEQLREAAGWVASVIAQQSPNAIQGTLRAIWAARDNSRPAALNLAPHFIAMASLDDWTSGQSRFSSGQRIEWRLR